MRNREQFNTCEYASSFTRVYAGAMFPSQQEELESQVLAKVKENFVGVLRTNIQYSFDICISYIRNGLCDRSSVLCLSNLILKAIY